MCQEPTYSTSYSPTDIDGKTVQCIGAGAVLLLTIECNGSCVCRTECFVYKAEHECEQADLWIGLHLPKCNEQQASSNQRN